jgi:hypothetical protein
MRRIIFIAMALLACAEVVADDRGSVVVVGVQEGKVAYEAEGKKTDLDGLIAALRDRATRTGIGPHDDVAFVIASDSLTVAQIQVLRSALQAYGFLKIRVLVYAPEKVRLWELGFGPKVIPFTKDRTELVRALSPEH